MRPTALSTTNATETLEPRSQGVAWKTVLNAESGAATWRVVEVFSQDRFPVEVRLSWSASGSVGAWAKVTVAHATQIRVFARTIKVELSNLSLDNENTVNVLVHDGLLPQTDNVWQDLAEYEGVNAVLVAVPPFASEVHVMTSDPALLPATEVTLVPDSGTSDIAKYMANALAWIPVGSAHVVMVRPPSDTWVRTVFKLTM